MVGVGPGHCLEEGLGSGLGFGERERSPIVSGVVKGLPGNIEDWPNFPVLASVGGSPWWDVYWTWGVSRVRVWRERKHRATV